MSTPPSPLLGPVQWISGTDVAECCNPGGAECDFNDFETVAEEASMALFEISGRQFTGLLESHVRPSMQTCTCWGTPSLGLGPWQWTSGSWGWAGTPGNWSFGAWGWGNECGDRMGCPPTSYVRLAGYPVREIEEVKIDGVVIPETPGLDAGDGIHFGGWRLDRWRRLTRMAIPGPPVVDQQWPACQDLSLDDDQPGTFSITYQHGIDPPQIAVHAAEQLACQLWMSCGGGGECVLPAGVTRVDRQGISVERGLLVNWFNPNMSTGLVAVDMFLRAFWCPPGRSRRPAVYSPDLQQFPLRMSTTTPTP